MQRLQIEPGDGELCIESDPEGEFVRADEAQAQIAKLEAQIKKLKGQVRRLHTVLAPAE